MKSTAPLKRELEGTFSWLNYFGCSKLRLPKGRSPSLFTDAS